MPLDEPLAAFPSWFMRITCDRCGKDRMLNEVHTPLLQRAMTLRDLLTHMRHDGLRAVGQGGGNCSPASRPPAAGRCGKSCCLMADVSPGFVPTGPTGF
jgi:hypothetical protein